MSEATKIEWCDATFNIAWGCTKVSPGCAHCYAERDAHRYGHDVWGPSAPRRTFGPRHWDEPHRWIGRWRAAGNTRPMRIFTSSMADVFEDHPTIAGERAKLWTLISNTPRTEWLVVTKRPENFARFLPDDWSPEQYPHVMLLVTAEDQERADERISILLRTPAARRGVSYEPALGPVDFQQLRGGEVLDREGAPYLDALRGSTYWPDGDHGANVPQIDWIIVGGESGPGARPFDVAWARSTIAQCRAAGVACFVKQLGAHYVDAEDGVGGVAASPPSEYGRLTRRLRDRKGGDMDEWPEDLRVRQFPTSVRP